MNRKIMIWFHGNTTDLGIQDKFITEMATELDINVVGIEYLGYGIYENPLDPEQMEQDSLEVYDWLLTKGYKPNNIWNYGRSLGTGPAIYLASKRETGFNVLISPYTNWKDVLTNRYGEQSSYLWED